jgi:hypothetical protein
MATTHIIIHNHATMSHLLLHNQLSCKSNINLPIEKQFTFCLDNVDILCSTCKWLRLLDSLFSILQRWSLQDGHPPHVILLQFTFYVDVLPCHSFLPLSGLLSFIVVRPHRTVYFYLIKDFPYLCVSVLWFLVQTPACESSKWTHNDVQMYPSHSPYQQIAGLGDLEW